ncbi:MAG: S8 family serine peptidase [Anaerolineaceae bacterium]
MGCANLRRNLGNPAVYLDCMQFMLAPFPQDGDPFIDGKPELGADVMNNSWGCPVVEGCDPGTFLQAVRALRTAGIFVVVSTGNSGDGGCGSVTDPPAIYDEVLSVGAVNSNRQRTSFSSLGPVTVDGSNRVKPDIMAPGEDVLSAYPEGTYSKASGTSMAGPHLVGVVALMWSANPDLIGDIDRTTEILEKTASKVMDVSISCENNTSFPNNETGYGIVNAYEAVKIALERK